jgi:hypothetical protein
MYLWRRIVGLLRSPRDEWRVIAAERDDVSAICQSYVSILAVIPPASFLLGIALTAGRYLGAAGISTAIVSAMVSWVLTIGGTVASAVVLEKVSPRLDADGDLTAAFKLVAYASTPFWLSGICYASGLTAPLVALGAAWALWIFYVGAPIVMTVPPARALAFVAASAAIVLGVNTLFRAVFTAFKVPYLGY